MSAAAEVHTAAARRSDDAVGLDESGAECGGKFDEREEAGSLHRHFPVLRKSGSRLDLALF